MNNFPVSGFSDVTDRENGRAKRSRGFWNGPFLHDRGAALADRASTGRAEIKLNECQSGRVARPKGFEPLTPKFVV